MDKPGMPVHTGEIEGHTPAMQCSICLTVGFGDHSSCMPCFMGSAYPVSERIFENMAGEHTGLEFSISGSSALPGRALRCPKTCIFG